MKWFIKHGIVLIHIKSVFRYVVKYGTVEDLEWIKANGADLDDEEIMGEASTMGDMVNLKWCFVNKFNIVPKCYVFLIKALSDDYTKKIAQTNIDWLIEHNENQEYNSAKLFSLVAKNDNLPGMKWLKKRECKYDNSVLTKYIEWVL